MADRDLKDLDAALQPLAVQFLADANAALAPSTVKITTTWRSRAEQAVAHANGFSPAAPGQSPHECCLADGTPASRAFDWSVFNPDGSYVKDGSDARYTACGEIARRLELVWGGDFQHAPPDVDHAEMADWRTILKSLRAIAALPFVVMGLIAMWIGLFFAWLSAGCGAVGAEILKD